MKHILLYVFICFSTCSFAQAIGQHFVSTDNYGIAASSAETDPKITIFPNPTADFITVEDLDGVVAKVSFYNLLGKEVLSTQVNGSEKFDLMGFQNGIYLVQLKDQQGKIIQTVRIKKI